MFKIENPVQLAFRGIHFFLTQGWPKRFVDLGLDAKNYETKLISSDGEYIGLRGAFASGQIYFPFWNGRQQLQGGQ